MGFKYLNGKSWSQITREERYFCSHLYHFLIGKEKEFIAWLNDQLGTQFNSDQEWEISYEVCFYRDYYKLYEKELPKELRKRTFDLVLFSDTEIIIIEAKVQQPFKKAQIKNLKSDIKRLGKLLKEHGVKIKPLLLCSKKYYDNFNKKHKNKEKTFLSGFKHITWQQLFVKFEKEIFLLAEKLYKK
ncbi:MAG: hypothetical protein PVF17_04960 [Ignavibacteria bacterium]|jgi:hypothetical protein